MHARPATFTSLVLTCIVLGTTPTKASEPKATSMSTPRVYYGHPTGRHTKDPSVVEFKGRYIMYHSLQRADGTWSCAAAESSNLLNWKDRGTLDLKVPSGKVGAAAPDALVHNGEVHLFFQSYGGSGTDKILYAHSADGVAFEQDPVEPIAYPTDGDWNNGRAIDAEPQIVGDELFVYWATRDPRGRVQMVGLSRAPLDADWSDPASYTHASTEGAVLAPTVPTELDPEDLDLGWEQQCIEAPTLLEHKGLYYMFYAGAYNNSPQQIGVAVSRDGVKYRRLFGGRPILGPGPKGSWNASESGHPGVFVHSDGDAYLFYQGDNHPDGIAWHLSMVPIRWKKNPEGGPDLPVLAFDEPLKPRPASKD